MNVTLSAIRLLGTINRCLAIKGGDKKSKDFNIYLHILLLFVENDEANCPKCDSEFISYLVQNSVFWWFSQSLVSTNVSPKMNHSQYIFNGAMSPTCILGSFGVFCREVTCPWEKVCVGFVYPNFFFRSAVVEVILCSGAEQGGCVCSPSASPSVGQRLPGVQQVAQISEKFST